MSSPYSYCTMGSYMTRIFMQSPTTCFFIVASVSVLDLITDI
jgi:hypothetical protein